MQAEQFITETLIDNECMISGNARDIRRLLGKNDKVKELVEALVRIKEIASAITFFSRQDFELLKSELLDLQKLEEGLDQ